jgi:hypothetical protein
MSKPKRNESLNEGIRHLGLRGQSEAATPLSHGTRLPKAAWRCASRRSPGRFLVPRDAHFWNWGLPMNPSLHHSITPFR